MTEAESGVSLDPGPSARANAAFGIAIAGLVFSLVPCCCMSLWAGLPLNVVGLVLGMMEKNAIEAGQSSSAGMGQLKNAKIFGFIGFGFNALWLALVLLELFGIAAIGLIGGLSSLGH